MTVNKATLDLMKEFEGLRLQAYPDPGTGGEPITIGYGTTARAGVGIVPKLGMTITKSEADEYFNRAMVKFAAQIRPKITAPINENEFGAFMSLAYNIGPGAFAKSSALRHFNAGDKAKAANAIMLWNKAGGKVMRGLERRRAAEKALFLTPVSSKPVAVSKPPVAVVKPDHKPITPTTTQNPNPPRHWITGLLHFLANLFGRK
jgi:lysozyme